VDRCLTKIVQEFEKEVPIVLWFEDCSKEVNYYFEAKPNFVHMEECFR